MPWCSTLPIPSRGESAWYPSLITTGVRSMAIACRRSAKCPRECSSRRLEKLVVWLRARHRGVGALVDALSTAGYTRRTASYLRIDRAGTAPCGTETPTPYKRLIAEAKLGYGHIRASSPDRCRRTSASCNDYPGRWSKEPSEAKDARSSSSANSPRDRNARPPPFRPERWRSPRRPSTSTASPRRAQAPSTSPPASPGQQPTKAPVLVGPR